LFFLLLFCFNSKNIEKTHTHTHTREKDMISSWFGCADACSKNRQNGKQWLRTKEKKNKNKNKKKKKKRKKHQNDDDDDGFFSFLEGKSTNTKENIKKNNLLDIFSRFLFLSFFVAFVFVVAVVVVVVYN